MWWRAFGKCSHFAGSVRDPFAQALHPAVAGNPDLLAERNHVVMRQLDWAEPKPAAEMADSAPIAQTQLPDDILGQGVSCKDDGSARITATGGTVGYALYKLKNAFSRS